MIGCINLQISSDKNAYIFLYPIIAIMYIFSYTIIWWSAFIRIIFHIIIFLYLHYMKDYSKSWFWISQRLTFDCFELEWSNRECRLIWLGPTALSLISAQLNISLQCLPIGSIGLRLIISSVILHNYHYHWQSSS